MIRKVWHTCVDFLLVFVCTGVLELSWGNLLFTRSQTEVINLALFTHTGDPWHPVAFDMDLNRCENIVLITVITSLLRFQ